MSNSETPWTVAHRAPLSMGFSRQGYWSGVSCPPPGYLPNPGIETASYFGIGRQVLYVCVCVCVCVCENICKLPSVDTLFSRPSVMHENASAVHCDFVFIFVTLPNLIHFYLIISEVD